MKRSRDAVELLEDEVGVSNNLGGGPGAEHGGVPVGSVELGEGERDGVHEEEAGGDLHEGCEDGGGDDAWGVSRQRGSLES